MTDTVPTDSKQPLNFRQLSFAVNTGNIRRIVGLLKPSLQEACVLGTVSQAHLGKEQEKLVSDLSTAVSSIIQFFRDSDKKTYKDGDIWPETELTAAILKELPDGNPLKLEVQQSVLARIDTALNEVKENDFKQVRFEDPTWYSYTKHMIRDLRASHNCSDTESSFRHSLLTKVLDNVEHTYRDKLHIQRDILNQIDQETHSDLYERTFENMLSTIENSNGLAKEKAWDAYYTYTQLPEKSEVHRSRIGDIALAAIDQIPTDQTALEEHLEGHESRLSDDRYYYEESEKRLNPDYKFQTLIHYFDRENERGDSLKVGMLHEPLFLRTLDAIDGVLPEARFNAVKELEKYAQEDSLREALINKAIAVVNALPRDQQYAAGDWCFKQAQTPEQKVAVLEGPFTRVTGEYHDNQYNAASKIISTSSRYLPETEELSGVEEVVAEDILDRFRNVRNQAIDKSIDLLLDGSESSLESHNGIWRHVPDEHPKRQQLEEATFGVIAKRSPAHMMSDIYHLPKLFPVDSPFRVKLANLTLSNIDLYKPHDQNEKLLGYVDTECDHLLGEGSRIAQGLKKPAITKLFSNVEQMPSNEGTCSHICSLLNSSKSNDAIYVVLTDKLQAKMAELPRRQQYDFASSIIEKDYHRKSPVTGIMEEHIQTLNANDNRPLGVQGFTTAIGNLALK